jgi:hypothetical protein
MKDYPGTANTPSVVDAPPTGAHERVDYVLWRERASGGWFKEAVGSFDHVKTELDAERHHYGDATTRPRYRMVKVIVREEAVEVALP